MRIAILTFHRAYNCGAMLQAWALKTVLERMGHFVVFPRCNDVGRNPLRFMIQDLPKGKKGVSLIRSLVGRLLLDLLGYRAGVRCSRLYDLFRERYLPEANCATEEMLSWFDCVIVGSDQVFNPAITQGWTSVFLCENAPANVKKVVYAASLGDRYLEDRDELRLDNALMRFDNVSFREPYKNFPVVADPTLLLAAKDYDCFCDKCNPLGCEYLCVYSVSACDCEIQRARAVANKMGLRLIYIHPWGRTLRNDVPEMVANVSPALLINYIRHSRCVVAGSFHGTVIAVIHGKPFVSYSIKYQGKDSRVAAFLRRIGLLDHFADLEMTTEDMVAVLGKGIPKISNDCIGTFAEYSKQWLRDALK